MAHVVFERRLRTALEMPGDKAVPGESQWQQDVAEEVNVVNEHTDRRLSPRIGGRRVGATVGICFPAD